MLDGELPASTGFERRERKPQPLFPVTALGDYSKHRRHVFLDVEVEREHIRCMLDTGSTANLMSETLFNQLGEYEPLDSRETPNFVSANGRPLTVLKVIVFPFEYMGRHFFHRWYVVRDLASPLLMGGEMMNLHRAGIDYEKGMVFLDLHRCEMCDEFYTHFPKFKPGRDPGEQVATTDQTLSPASPVARLPVPLDVASSSLPARPEKKSPLEKATSTRSCSAQQ